MAIYNCEQCGQPFKRPPSHITRHPHNFCSRPCREAWCSLHVRGEQNPRFVQKSILCEQCGAAFKRMPGQISAYQHHFCSQACHAQWKTISKIEQHCKQCGIPILKKRSDLRRIRHCFCSAKCYHRYTRGVEHPCWQGGTIKYRGPNWLEQRRKARKRDQYRCRYCGITQKNLGRALDVHHIRPFRDFGYIPGKNDHYIQANHLDNLISLCRSCHKRTELGQIPLQLSLLI